MLMSLGLLFIFGLYSIQQITEREQQHIQEKADVLANALADRLTEILRSKQESLQIVAQSSRIIAALRGDKTTRNIATQQMSQHLSDLIHLRLYSIYFDDIKPDIHGNTPVGYAGVDMVKRAMRDQPTPAEVHQINSGSPYIALAVPVKIGRETKGVLFAAWSMSLVKNAIRPTPRFPGELQILQQKPNSYILAGDEIESAQTETNRLLINDSVWDLLYQSAPSNWGVLNLITILLVLSSILLLAAGVQYGLLHRDLSHDLQYLITSIHLDKKKLVPGKTRLALTYQLIEHLNQLLSEEKLGESATPKATRQHIPAHIFRAYDIRGIFGKELNAEIAYLLGQAFAEKIKQKKLAKVYLAYDTRKSSPELTQAFEQGLLEQGINVIQLGMSPVALLYYIMHKDKQSAAVMVSGSHNPPEYNGFKLYSQAEPLMDLSALLGRMIKKGFPHVDRGKPSQIEVKQEYLDSIQLAFPHPLKIVIDAGNGAAGELACDLLTQQGCEVIPLYCEPNGVFPNHHPDPSKAENLIDLSAKVLATEADLGIAFDGDGDRISLVDDLGQIVCSAHVMMLLAKDILQRHPKAKIIYDVKSSKHIAEYIEQHNGQAILCSSGYTRIWHEMRNSDAIFGGEFSGHYFIRENWCGADDAIYVAARLLQIISQNVQTIPLSEQLKTLPKSSASPEYQMMLKEEEAPLILQALEKHLPIDANIIRIDGLRIEFAYGWGLVRSSNTLPSLTFRFEADDETQLNKIKRQFRELLQQVVPDKKIPF